MEKLKRMSMPKPKQNPTSKKAKAVEAEYDPWRSPFDCQCAACKAEARPKQNVSWKKKKYVAERKRREAEYALDASHQALDPLFGSEMQRWREREQRLREMSWEDYDEI